MMHQIYMDFNLNVSFRDITFREIEYWYRPLFKGLLKKEEG